MFRWMPDLTRSPEGQTRAQRVIGALVIALGLLAISVRW